MSSYEEKRQAHVADFFRVVPEAVDRIMWAPERIARLRTELLRETVNAAKRESRWHARRLADVDTDALTEADLARLPTMTKSDVMASWDDIVTDRRLTLDLCERHLERLVEPAYLLDRYHVVSTGGSSGERGVFVWGWEEWAEAYAAYMRWVLRAREAVVDAGAQEGPLVLCTVGGSSYSHPGVAMAATFTTDLLRIHQFSVASPLAAIVEGLNRAQPFLVFGYASALRLLAAETEAGRLRIRPRIVTSAVEPLLPEIAESIKRAWGPILLNAYGTAELGPHGVSCPQGAGIHLSDDSFIVEPVDGDGRPVVAGERAQKYYATGLRRRTQPLIRYEITDELTPVDGPCACGSWFRRVEDVQGRYDDVFRYDCGVEVHPHVFRASLGRHREILEYQVRQTPRGADVVVRVAAPLANAAIENEITKSLHLLGLPDPQVALSEVDAIERVGASRKLKRFVPLQTSHV